MLSGEEPHLFRAPNDLGPAPGVQLVEQAAGMGLHGVLAHEELFRNLAVAQPRGDETQNLELARRDAQLLSPRAVDDERRGGCDRNFFHDYTLRAPGQLGAEPDAEAGEEEGDEAGVDLDRLLDDEKVILDRFEGGDEETAEEAVEEDGAAHALRSAAAAGRQASVGVSNGFE